MKRSLTLIVCIALLLTACGGGVEDETSVPTFQTTPTGTGSVQTTAPSEDVTEPEQEPSFKSQELILEGETYGCMDDLVEALRAEGRLDQEDHSITIEGLQTPVTLHLRYDAVVGYTVFGYHFDVEREALAYTALGGTARPVLYDYEHTVILNIWYNEIGYTLIMTPDGSWAHHPTEGRSLMVYANGDGELLCSRMAVKFNTAVHQWDTAPIDLANSRDDFYYALGTCTIEGQYVTPVLEQEFTISDVYDLDALFLQGKADGLYPQFETLEELLAWNWDDQHKPGEEQEETLWYQDVHREDGTLSHRIAYEPTDEWDRKVYTEDYDGQERLICRTHFEYGIEGHHFLFSYDDEGHLTEATCLRYETEVFRYTMAYDAGGRLIRKDRYSGDALSGTQEYAYAGDGSYTETFSQDGQKKYTYGFDSQGALVRHVTYEDGTATETQDLSGLVEAQLLLEARLPMVDNAPIYFSYDYDGCDLVFGSFTCEEVEETTYGGSYHKPLSGTSWYEEGRTDWVCTYDDQGRIGSRVCTEDGVQTLRDTFTYEGTTEIQRRCDAEGQLIFEFRRTYEDGVLTGYECRTPEGLYREDYHRQGRTMTVTTYRDGQQEQQYEQVFDEAGRLIKGGEDGQIGYQYEDGMLRSIHMCSGVAFFDYRVVYVTEAQARELTEMMNGVLEWVW